MQANITNNLSLQIPESKLADYQQLIDKLKMELFQENREAIATRDNTKPLIQAERAVFYYLLSVLEAKYSKKYKKHMAVPYF